MHDVAAARGPVAKHWGSVHIGVAENIKLETLHQIIDQIARISGCPACGLLGIDLTFRGGDPEVNALRNLQGVNEVGLGR